MRALVRGILTLLTSILFCSPPTPAVAQNGEWPQWRGSDRSNASRETGLLQEWPTNGPPLVWQAVGLGDGITSVSVAGGRVFTVGNREGGEFVFALDAKAGGKIWAARLGKAIEENRIMRWLTQRTPTVDGDRLYSLSGNGELFCLSAVDGRKLWQKKYTEDFGTLRPFWGFCDRPLVEGDRLICTPFGASAFIAALDKRTGEVVWKTRIEAPPAAGHASLVASEAGGVRQYIVFHSRGLAGFAADDGRLLWDYARPGTRTGMTYTPVASGDLVFSPNGYGGGLVGIQLIREGGHFKPEERYLHRLNFDPFQDSTVLVGNHVYAMESRKPVCFELKTGDPTWTTEAAPQIGRAAMTHADRCLYIRDVKGMMSLLRVTPQDWKQAGRFQIPEYEQSDGVTAPVVAGGRLYLRDNSRLFCYDISAGALTTTRPASQPVAVGLTARELEEDETAPRPPRVGVNRAPDAVYVATPQDVVERMLLEAGVKKDSVVVDLGSGDGRIVIAAAKNFGCKAVGYEIDERLVTLSREAVTKANLQHLVTIEHKDIFTVDLSGVDVVAAFLYPRLMERLIPQFGKLKPGARIVSHQFEMPGVKPDRTLLVDSAEDGDKHKVLLWTAPLKME